MIPTTRTRRPRLETVRQRLDRWRARRTHPHAAMPPGLWAAAVALTRQHGLYRTARALRLDYGALKRHAEAVGSGERRPTFVELPGAAPCPTTPSCAMELEGPGATLRLRVCDLSLAEVATLGRRLAGLEP